MKRFAPVLFGILVTAAGSAVLAAGTVAYVTPDSLHWIAGTGASKGSSTAVLTGNPDKSGFAAIRVKMPNGYTNQPHYHATNEYITVIQGTLLFGTGDTIDKSKARVLPAGSFIEVPAGVHHWSMARGTTIEQASGQGPLTNLPIKRGSM
jgi:quercetin dioxygenase-like cupin family protein